MVAVPSRGRATLVEAPRVAPEAAVTHGLYERHAAKILSYCQHQLGSREEAEDAVQTTFMNAFRALGKGIVPESETAWLFKIAENVCLSRRRSSWRRNRIESPSDFEVIEEIVPGPSRQRDELIGIEAALASMPEQQRRAILLREWQGLSYREIAAELELSQSAVETLIFRARRSLAQGLEQPETLKVAKSRKGLRRALHAVDAGALLASLKTLFTGAAAVKATAAAVAVTAATGAAVTVAPQRDAKPTKAPAPVRATVLPTAAPASSPGSVAVAPLAPVERHSATAVEVRKQPAAPAAGVPARAAKKPVAAPVAPLTPQVADPVVELPVADPPAPAAKPEQEKPKDAPLPPAAAKPEKVERPRSDAAPALQEPRDRAKDKVTAADKPGPEKARERKEEKRADDAVLPGAPADGTSTATPGLLPDAASAVEPTPDSESKDHGNGSADGKGNGK